MELYRTPVPLEAAPVAAAKADALDSGAIIAPTAGSDEPSVAPPSAARNLRRGMSIAIGPSTWGSRALDHYER